jgi:hypothetical protein
LVINLQELHYKLTFRSRDLDRLSEHLRGGSLRSQVQHESAQAAAASQVFAQAVEISGAECRNEALVVASSCELGVEYYLICVGNIS